ncbi:DUF3577 domain-containing protein [Endozoicomonas sp. SM1973]|uniref:DUF3577 domain-containing protein n=1 Tax=Spartinivicinus marinus TaxID=2994442 RepID=A0A853I536_9GAMM|nr:DUF3577 domain-containing protein [Spartinivicinus marinus]MCX4030166.1 DUF3577 domain-containing protein [Spartinivicinus marinus]NYZ67809.1 DUF3577 domain-containing protein [Spartinivicinus marinus]
MKKLIANKTVIKARINVRQGSSLRPIYIPYTVFIYDGKNQNILFDLKEALKEKSTILLGFRASNPEPKPYVIIEGEFSGKIDFYLSATLLEINHIEVDGVVVSA